MFSFGFGGLEAEVVSEVEEIGPKATLMDAFKDCPIKFQTLLVGVCVIICRASYS